MGSTGSGRLSDYSSKPPQQEKSINGGGGFSGGSPGEDPCARAFSATLEEESRMLLKI